MIIEAIRETKKYSQEVTGLDYVEKIIQVTYRIPPARAEQMTSFLRECVSRSATETIISDVEEPLIIEGNNRERPQRRQPSRRLVREAAIAVVDPEMDPRVIRDDDVQIQVSVDIDQRKRPGAFPVVRQVPAHGTVELCLRNRGSSQLRGCAGDRETTHEGSSTKPATNHYGSGSK